MGSIYHENGVAQAAVDVANLLRQDLARRRHDRVRDICQTAGGEQRSAGKQEERSRERRRIC